MQSVNVNANANANVNANVNANTNNNDNNSFIPEGNREVVITNMLEYRKVIENNNIIYVPLVAKIVTPLDFMNEDLQFCRISYHQIVRPNGQLRVIANPNMNLKKLLFAICKNYVSLSYLMRYTIIHHISVLRHHISNNDEYLWTYIFETICKTSLRVIAKELVTMVSVANIHLNLRVKLRNNELISLYI